MAETVVVSGGDGESLEEGSAHQAAVHEGAAAAHEEAAAAEAAAAREAAEVAAASLAAVGEAAAVADQAAAEASQAADTAAYGADAVLEAIQAQTAVLSSMIEEIRTSRQTPAPAPTGDQSTKKADRVPGKPKRKGSWYFGG